jgi:hypothetical protein
VTQRSSALGKQSTSFSPSCRRLLPANPPKPARLCSDILHAATPKVFLQTPARTASTACGATGFCRQIPPSTSCNAVLCNRGRRAPPPSSHLVRSPRPGFGRQYTIRALTPPVARARAPSWAHSLYPTDRHFASTSDRHIPPPRVQAQS